ncbi:hypothetical protein VTO42DRAFT_39 [Malbranchea cinnamomea]
MMDPNIDVKVTGMSPVESNVVGKTSRSLQPSSSRLRRPSVLNACQRCRKRHIRCDERTPCGTCARLNVLCVRHDHRLLARCPRSALEERVRVLEEQLAKIGARSEANSLNEPSVSGGVERTRQVPQLRIDTAFSTEPYALDYRSSVDISPSTPNIPTIEITQYDTPGYLDVPPSPSLVFSSSSRASTPDPFLVPSPTLSPMRRERQGSLFLDSHCFLDSPSMPCYSDEAHLSPFSRNGRDRSASLSLDVCNPHGASNLNREMPAGISDPSQLKEGVFPGLSLQQPSAMLPPGHLEHQIYQESPSQRFPSRNEAEMFTMAYFDHFGQHHPTSNRQALSVCLEAVYNVLGSTLPQLTAVSQSTKVPPTEYSFGMAQFHVFMVMACGIRLLNAGSTTPMSSEHREMLETCYHRAIQQVHSMCFWDEPGGQNAATYLLHYVKSSPQETGLS